jgi:hypothetical protein
MEKKVFWHQSTDKVSTKEKPSAEAGFETGKLTDGRLFG